MSSDRPPLPREIEDDPCAPRLRAWCEATARPLWRAGELLAPVGPLGRPLGAALGAARRRGHLVLGLEAAGATLDREARGLVAADARRGGPRIARVSRLLLVARDGAERFYRQVERMAREHVGRVLVCRLDADAGALGRAVTGRPAAVKAVLVCRRAAVVEILRALAESLAARVDGTCDDGQARRGGSTMAITVGDKLPALTLKEMGDAGPKDVSVAELTAGKRTVLFAVPGAFTPTCSMKHLPGFVEQAAQLRAKGIDEIVCLSVNDAFVMGAWGKAQGATGKVRLVADGNGEFTKALGLELDASGFGMGKRSKRYAMIVLDGTVEQLLVDESGLKESSAESVLAKL